MAQKKFTTNFTSIIQDTCWKPKKLRRREVDETVNHSKISKRNLKIKCTKCDKFGHNIRGYKNPQNKTIRVIIFNTISDLNIHVIDY